MDKIERARQLFYELEFEGKRTIDLAVRGYEIQSRLAQNIN